MALHLSIGLALRKVESKSIFIAYIVFTAGKPVLIVVGPYPLFDHVDFNLPYSTLMDL